MNNETESKMTKDDYNKLLYMGSIPFTMELLCGISTNVLC